MFNILDLFVKILYLQSSRCKKIRNGGPGTYIGSVMIIKYLSNDFVFLLFPSRVKIVCLQFLFICDS